MKDLKQELKDFRYDFDVIQIINCTKDEEKEFRELTKNGNNLPEDIHTLSDGTHYRYKNTDLTDNELKELLLYKQIKYLQTIKNIMIFFVIVSIVTFIGTLILFSGM